MDVIMKFQNQGILSATTTGKQMRMANYIRVNDVEN